MLGGAFSQIPAIKYAKLAGYYVITCDYLPGNPGHRYSDEYHNISTVDLDKVLELARELKIDGIVAYASDPSALTAAYVSDKLNLPGSSYKSVFTLSRKDSFRKFLWENGFNNIEYSIVDSPEEFLSLKGINYPVVVKPVDSSGSKGVTIVLEEKIMKKAIEDAFTYSRCKRVIIEKYIESPYHQLHGDGFVHEGTLKFLGLCDQRFKEMVPISSVYPSTISEEIQVEVRREVQRLISKVGFVGGAINVEVRVTEDNRVFILEIGPRSGGNYVPQLMECATGFDEVKAIVDYAMGEKVLVNRNLKRNKCFQYIIGSPTTGRYEDIILDAGVREHIEKIYIHREKNELVNAYSSSADVVGVLIARYENEKILRQLMEQFAECVSVR
jgi:biotin carboxylase